MRRTLFLLTLAMALNVGAALGADDPGRGRILAARCTCHAQGNLDGEPASDLLEKMRAFKAGRTNNHVMIKMMKDMPEQDMRDLAAYFAGK